ncbi:TlpA family protein disulfide reductase [Cohnella massiliensis]|uniref:TlpA family protein disulfide reductase n=1 Tax=Cohnella massiliensis TaxID=1816691 RepID=UPI0009BB9CE1|nr:TlpA disulfide reductase family protein [Cohnella massiliensis]
MKKQLMLLAIVVILIVVAIVLPNRSNQEQTAKIGYRAPDFTLQGFDDTSYALADQQGKPMLVNFWTSWCGPCQKEAPDLVRLYDKYKNQIEFYAVNTTSDDNVADAAAFVRKFGLPFPVLLDRKGEVSKLYQVRSYPTTYFVDAKGTIRNINYGIVSPDSLEQTIIQTIKQS